MTGRLFTTTAAALALSAVAATAQMMPQSGTGALSTEQGGQVAVTIQAGGPVNVMQLLGPQCPGFASDQPNYAVAVTGEGQTTLTFRATSAVDTTMVVQRPDGGWLCDDDSGGNLDPMIRQVLGAGTYNIWVGTFSPGRTGTAQLVVVSEPLAPRTRQPDPDPQPEAAAIVPPTWYRAGGETIGPVDDTALRAAIEAGTLTRETFVWQNGMPEWLRASEVETVADLFPVIPPPPPPEEDVTPPPPPVEEPPAPPPPPADDPAPPADATEPPAEAPAEATLPTTREDTPAAPPADEPPADAPPAPMPPGGGNEPIRGDSPRGLSTVPPETPGPN